MLTLHVHIFALLPAYFANNPVCAGKVKEPFESYFSGSNAYFISNYRPENVKVTHHDYFIELGDSLE